MTLAQIAAVTTSCVIALSTGFGLGLTIGHPEPFVLGMMTNSSVFVNQTDADAGVSYPCVSNYGSSEIRCSFVGANTTWICGVYVTDTYPDYQKEERCEERRNP